MVEMIHRREAEWDVLPFASMVEVANFAVKLDQIVKEAMPDPPREVKSQVSYQHSDTDWLTSAEFQNVAADLPPLEEIYRIYIGSAFVDEDGSREKADDSAFRASIYMSGGSWVKTTLTVEGRKLTAVEGVLVTAKSAIDSAEEEKRRAERASELEEAERKRQAESAAAILKADADRARERDGGGTKSRQVQEGQAEDEEDQGPATVALPSRFRQFAYDPWTVTIGGGIIVAFVVVLITQT
jgi:hypothetical protein